SEVVEPSSEWLGAGETVDGLVQPNDEFGKLAGQLHPVAADVVEGDGLADPGTGVVGHGDAGEHAVDPETPCVVDEVDAVGLAMLLVEAPSYVGLADPAGDVFEVVVAEAELFAYGRALREVEHLAGGGAAAGELEKVCGDSEERVGLDERAVGEFDAELMGGVDVLDHVAEAEVGDDQRRVGLDVGAHDEDVARFEGVVVVEQSEEDFSEDVDLAGGAVAAVDLD